MKGTTMNKPQVHGGKNLCSQCRCFIGGVCRKQSWDYCKITRQK